MLQKKLTERYALDRVDEAGATIVVGLQYVGPIHGNQCDSHKQIGVFYDNDMTFDKHISVMGSSVSLVLRSVRYFL